MYPVLLDLSRHACLIVGGGAVAARKAAGLIDGGACRIRAIAPEFAGNFPGSVERSIGLYHPDQLEGVAVVFAATDRAEINDAIVRDARGRRILVNRADSSDEWPGDFTTPACWHDGAVTVAVSGGSAALSARMRNELRTHWQPKWTAMAEAMQLLRPEIRKLPNEDARRKLLRTLAEDEAMNVLSGGGVEALRHWITTQSNR